MVKRLIRALKAIPRRIWWVVALPIALLALLAVDRHVAGTAFAVWVGYLALTFRRRQKSSRTRAMKDKDIRWVNPSTGLPMFLNDVGGVDSAGHYYGEDPAQSHHQHER